MPKERENNTSTEHDKLSEKILTVLSFFGHKKSEHELAHVNGILPRVDTKRNSNSFRGQKYKEARYIIWGGQSSPYYNDRKNSEIQRRGKRKPLNFESSKGGGKGGEANGGSPEQDRIRAQVGRRSQAPSRR
jgi:hypothetical protein